MTLIFTPKNLWQYNHTELLPPFGTDKSAGSWNMSTAIGQYYMHFAIPFGPTEPKTKFLALKGYPVTAKNTSNLVHIMFDPTFDGSQLDDELVRVLT